MRNLTCMKPGHDVASGVMRLLSTALIGLLVAVVVGGVRNVQFGVLAGMVALGLSYVIWTLVALWPMDGPATRAHALREDAGAVAIEAVIATVCLGCLASIISVILLDRGDNRDVAAGVALAAVFCSWGMLHMMYAARYARTYYSNTPGGIDFNNEAEPCFRDFLYFSFNLGMTYQVSDTNVSTTELRSVILRHCLLSYVFGTVILAATINLVASIALG